MFGLLLLLAEPSFAQLKFGVTGGLNISLFHVSDDTYKEYVNRNRAGFVLGPTVVYNIPKTGLGFDLSALYDLRGAKSKSLEDSESVFCKSLQIPVNFRYGRKFDEMIYGFVFTGPQFGFNVGDKSIKTTTSEWTFKSSNISANVGLGVMLLSHLQISANYNFGLGKTGELDILNTNFKENGKMNAWQIAVAYYF